MLVGGTPSSHVGVPHPVMVGGVGTPSSHGGRYPPPSRSGWGVPHPASHGGGTPGTPLTIQTWLGMGGTLGTPHHRDLRWGYPSHHQTWDWVPPTIRPGIGLPPTIRPGMGLPPHHQTWDGVPPHHQTWDRVPPHHQTWDGVPPPPSDLGWGNTTPTLTDG